MTGRLEHELRTLLNNLDSGTDGGDVALAEMPRTRYQPAAPRAKRDPDAVTNIDRIILITAVLSSCLLSGWVVVTTVRYGWRWVW